jgi:hypothetical protein
VLRKPLLECEYKLVALVCDLVFDVEDALP